MEKQIEEIAVEFAKINCNSKGCHCCDHVDEYGSLELSCEDYLMYKNMAETFYNAGYRKASDVARETITEAIEVLQEKLLLSVMSNGRYVYEKDDVLFWLRTIPLRMKKKYESEGEE